MNAVNRHDNTLAKATTRLLPLLCLICALGAPSCGSGSSNAPPDARADTTERDASTLPDTQSPDLSAPDLSAPDTDTTDVADADAAENDTTDVADTDAVDASDTPDTNPFPIPEVCWTDLAVGEREVFYEGFEDGSEGISFGPGGFLYVTTSGQVWRLDADANIEPFAEVPTALGLAATRDDALFVASIGESFAPGDPDGGVYRVSAEGDVSPVALNMDSPNFIAMLPDGAALVSDDFDTRVWRVSPEGDVTEALTDIESPNGLAFSPDGATLYVASTFTPTGAITRVPVNPDGLPSGAPREEIAEFGGLGFPDGIAVDVYDRVYVAVNAQNKIARVPGDGSTEPEDVSTGLTNPASLAFGAAEGFDPCSIYVTELFGARVWRIAVGAPGAPLF